MDKYYLCHGCKTLVQYLDEGCPKCGHECKDPPRLLVLYDPEPAAQLYSLEFDEHQWEEILSLEFAPFSISTGDAMTRQQWMAICKMSLGKAYLIENNNYDPENADTRDDKAWVEELRGIADVILAEFKPADGKL